MKNGDKEEGVEAVFLLEMASSKDFRDIPLCVSYLISFVASGGPHRATCDKVPGIFLTQHCSHVLETMAALALFSPENEASGNQWRFFFCSLQWL